MADNSIDEFKFLLNKPLGEDLFRNKSQEKIAAVISEKIINDPDFKIIGIDGAWGSGKSNLVHLAEKKTEKTHKFFIYDVWGHQEDEQRRAILIELTEFIKNEKDLLRSNSRKNWDDKLKLLLSNSKTTTTVNQPYLSVGFIFSLLSIVYIPTVNVFKDSIKEFFEIELWFWKLLLVAFPIFIVIGIYVYNLCRNWKNKNGFLKSFHLSAEETFQVYTNKQKEETKIETISENQTSVRDFQKWMEEIDDDLLKKVVLVFDNFDRLPKKHILNIWSSIHIFFAEKKYKNIKVILPFDREHIQNAFKELNSDGSNKTFGDDYVNKTFDIVFRVTLPIMSDWKQFFQKQWKMAFINQDDDESRLVIQVYEFLNKRITPREIIAFINEIVTIKLLDRNFKERYIAIFVLQKDEILKNPLSAITELDYLGGLKSIYSNDAEFAKQLTSIIYHIDVDNAVELIYTQELKDSLNKNDIGKFNSICKSDFADSIFGSVITEIDILENPIITLSKIDVDSRIPKLLLMQAWKKLYFQALRMNEKVEKLEIQDWQVILIENYSDDKYLTNLLNIYVDLVDDSNTLSYVKLIDELVERLTSERVIPLIVSKQIDPQNFIELVENRGDEYMKYKLTSEDPLIDTYMSKLRIEDILKLTNTSILCQIFLLKEYRALLVRSLNSFVDQSNIQMANDVLVKIKETIKVDETSPLKGILDDAKIYSLYVNNASSLLDIVNELIAMRIARGTGFNSSYKSQFESVLNGDDVRKAVNIGSTILNYCSYDDLLLSSHHFSNSLLFKQVIQHIFSSSVLVKRSNIISLISSYDQIKSSLGFNNDELLLELNKWKLDRSKIDFSELDDVFIKDCFKFNSLRISVDFSQEFNKRFAYLDEDGFNKVFSGDTDVHFKYFEHLNSESLTQSSLDEFKKNLLVRMEDNNITERWWNILDKYELNNSQLSIVNTLKDIRDKFLNNSIELDVEVAKVMVPLFFKYDLLEPSTDLFRTVIKNSFLNDNEFVDTLIANESAIRNLYQLTIQIQKEDFRNIINERRSVNEKIENLAKLIGIRKSK